MKRGKWILMVTMVFLLSLVVSAQGPQTSPAPTQPQEDRIEAAHGKLLSGEDRAKDASRLTEAVAPALPASAASNAPVPRKNFIDEHIFGRMDRDKIPHAPLAGDEEFLRRAYLDATGLLPAPDQVRSFMSNPDPNKRDKLIDSLIGSEEFTDEWAYHFGELLRTREAQFHLWTSSGSRWTGLITMSSRTSLHPPLKMQKVSRRLSPSMIPLATLRLAVGYGRTLMTTKV